MSEFDAYKGLSDTVRMKAMTVVSDPLELTQPLNVWSKARARVEALRLYHENRPATFLGQQEPPTLDVERAVARSVYEHDFRDGRPRGNLDAQQRAVQDLRPDYDD